MKKTEPIPEIDLVKAVHAVDAADVQPIKHPIDPPEMELFAQRIVANVGQDKNYVLTSYKEAGLDPLVHTMFLTWEDVPAVVKSRVKHLMSLTASNTVATRREVEEFLTAIIRDDQRLASRSDRRKLFTMDAVKELCKMRGYYSPVEIRSTHEVIVPDSIRNLSDADLARMAEAAKSEVIDVQADVLPPQMLPTPNEAEANKEE